MASEIRVNKIENRSGLGTVTFADTGVDLAGIVTATTFSGSGASLTALPAATITGTLPAISAANLTNVPAANVVGVHTSLTVTNATTTGTAVVGGGVTISESGIEASGIGITCASFNGGQISGRRNIIINGDMRIAQRGTSSTTAGYETVDRIETSVNDLDEIPTFAQVDVASGTTPYTSGFRKAFKMTNGNQTGGAGTLDKSEVHYKIEAQDIACSGWNYTSSSSFITLSFWVKSSVAQNFFGHLKTTDNTAYNYPFETGSLSADTWTKVTKTIPGNSNLVFNNDNGIGLTILFYGFMGTALTGSVSLDTWAAYVSSTRTPDQTSTWHTTNDATLEFTGLQLEVGSQATPFEHRRLSEELHECQRYYCELGRAVSGESGYVLFPLQAYNTSSVFGTLARLPNTMRSKPTCTLVGNITFSNKSGGNVYAPDSPVSVNQANKTYVGTGGATFSTNHFIQGGCAVSYCTPDDSNYIKVDAEL